MEEAHSPKPAPLPDRRFTVGPFTMADYAEAVALWKSTPGVHFSEKDEPGPLARFLQHNRGLSSVARATASGRLIGVALCGHDYRYAILSRVAVAADCRGWGVGRALHERITAGLRADGILSLILFVYRDNTLAIRFWEHLGYETWSETVVMDRDL